MPDRREDEPLWEALRDPEDRLIDPSPHSHQTVAERALEIAGMSGDEFLLAHAGQGPGAGGVHLTVAEQALLYQDALGSAAGQAGSGAGSQGGFAGFGTPANPDDDSEDGTGL
jgi:hypothetical protein